MALRHGPPNEALNRELRDVSRDSDALSEFLRAPNAIPDSFPSSQLVAICQSLGGLPQGTAEGCRVPLEYARVRLPAIRREHILSEDRIPPLADPDAVPPLVRGMGLDRLLKDLIAAVTTALDEYRRQATEPFDDTVGPEPVVDTPDDANLRAALAQSQSVETELRNAGDEIRATTVPDSSRADRLLRTMKDAEGLNRLARAELGMKSVVLRWYRAAVDALQDYPALIRRFGEAVILGVDVAQPFAKRWNDLWSHLSDFILDELREIGETFVELARSLEKRGARTLAEPRDEEIDPRQIKAEHKARELILSGKPVPPAVAALVKRLNLSGEKYAHTNVSDFRLLARLRHITGLDIRYSNVSTLDFLSSFQRLTSLSVDAKEARDLSPLVNLTRLTSLSVRTDRASDLSPLSGLTALNSLSVQANQVSDLSPLAGLTGLTSLSVQANQVSDLSPLARLTRLTSLSMQFPQARDLSPLTGLTALTSLSVHATQARDLSPLAGLTALTSLCVQTAQARDLSPLAGLARLTSLYVRAHLASDLSPLAGLTALTSLNITGCAVTDLSPLSHLKNLMFLRASNTKITDWRPVAHVPTVEK